MTSVPNYQGLTFLNYFFNLSLYEADLSALQNKEEENTWISNKNEVQRRQENIAAETCEEQEKVDALNGRIVKKTRNYQKKERF